MSQFITTHNPSGRAIFTSKIPSEQKPLPLPAGSMTILYTTHSMPVDLGTEADLDAYAVDRVKGLPPGSPAPANGTTAAIVRIPGGVSTPMRRTISLGVFVVVEGKLVLKLDGGEERRVRVGDAVVLRSAL